MLKNLTWALAIALVAVSLTLSLIDSAALDQVYQSVEGLCLLNLRQLGGKVETVSDIGHGVAGFVLTLSLFKSLRGRLLLVILLLIVFFSGCEVLQSFTATRQASVADIARSAAGIGFAAALIGVKRLLCNHISEKAL